MTGEPITFAKAGGPPDNWNTLAVLDGDEKLEYVIEADTVAGYALQHFKDEKGDFVLDGDDAAIRRIESPRLRIVISWSDGKA